ncbi:hypothetical protein JKL49_13130 [Phenylobacterium sp. 20VBR1]|uniref:Uncharacterized protein n=2 Tax=Phenylobacterium glaciei TaxID=2803784 RepID=A0A941D197_9CAUL|nr:hypothetical protein [Phenylobacterium glaciei]MBR7620331.1 hypothetical protein [Phenylobacterium glaciei]
MTDFKISQSFRSVGPARHPSDMDLEDQTAELMEMASLLSPRDMATLSVIVRRAAEISESEGEDVAIAVLDQIHSILDGRVSDA